MTNTNPTRRQPAHRFSFEPIYRRTGVATLNEFADLACIQAIGWNENMVRHAHQSGITARKADELACAIGTHPACCWPDWYERTAKPGDYETSAA